MKSNLRYDKNDLILRVDTSISLFSGWGNLSGYNGQQDWDVVVRTGYLHIGCLIVGRDVAVVVLVDRAVGPAAAEVVTL